MKARTEVVVGLDSRGCSTAHRLHCEAPLLVRVGDRVDDHLELLLVGGAAGPLGGDELTFDLTVEDGARVRIRSVAAQMVQPGAHGARSTLDVKVAVGRGASLDWCPQPTVSVAGSDHVTTTRLHVAADAEVRWAEHVALGRHDEEPGRLTLRQRVEIDGVVALDHTTPFGPGPLRGPGGHGLARRIESTVLIGACAASAASADVADDRVSAVLPIADRVALLVGLTV